MQCDLHAERKLPTLKSFRIPHQLHSLINVHTCGIGWCQYSPNPALIDTCPSVDHEIYVIFCYSSLSLTSTYSRSFMNALHCNLYIYVCAGHEALCIMHWYLPSKLVSHILVVKGSITHVTWYGLSQRHCIYIGHTQDTVSTLKCCAN